MVRRKPTTHLRDIGWEPNVSQLSQMNNIHIFMDIFYVNKIAFIHTVVEKINFRSLQHLSTRKMREIIKGITILKQKYEARHITIQQ